jgi:hypothetical protein
MRTRHHELTPSLGEQPQAIDTTLARSHNSTWLHAWLEPLAAHARASGNAVVDGLGAVWIKGFRQNPKPARALFAEAGFQDFDDSIHGFSEAHSWQTLSILTTRTARAVSLAPMRLFGPDVEVYLPLITPRTLDAALSPEIYRRRGIQLAQALLTLADPELASMPSTNDSALEEKRRAARPQFHPYTLQRFVSVIGECEPALRMLAPHLVRAVSDRDTSHLARTLSDAGPYRAILGVYAYASWITENSVVSDILD